MTPREHYQEAERLANDGQIALAQVHATLALFDSARNHSKRIHEMVVEKR